nr:non-ribosomal peptide synthase/polyketide synthase [Paenibacillus sp. IHB B 3084]
MAYVIYTSGSTGKPKGVMVEHHSVINRLVWMRDQYDVSVADTILQKTAFTFDVSVWELFMWSLIGSKLSLLSPGGEKSPEQIVETIARDGVSLIHFVPAMLHAFLEYLEQQPLEAVKTKLETLRHVFASGEALPPQHVARFQRGLLGRVGTKLTNMYGPTEATVEVAYFDCDPEESYEVIPIGKPLQNIRLYIVKEGTKQLQPVGVAGELCIGGVGVARGYLNQPELTDEKFVTDPFAAGEPGYERMYRTGDLTQWLPDGNIEYLGRIDHQVKIRGYRIELGEVELHLLKVAHVQEAVVVARADEAGQKQMIAYYVAEQEIPASELRSELGQELPSYMVPLYFVQMDQMPLSPNGKIDRKALPAPEDSLQSGVDYAEPRTVAERALVTVWQSVLGVKTVGILDNFFDLGGDSIKAIQISSRVFQKGYKLEMKDLFQYPTVEVLAPHIHEVSRIADQGEVSGETALLPIQHWFFSQERERPEHFNQAVMLYSAAGFDETAVHRVMDRIVEHHDALRTVFRKQSSGYKAWTRRVEEGLLYTLETADFREVTAYAEVLEAKATEIQSSINLSEGPLVKLGLFHGADGDHLLMAVHHLVMDAVSWRILFEDFSTGYEQAQKGEPVRLPYKTDSFQTWARELSSYANSPAAESDAAYWQQLEQAKAEGVAPLPKDFSYDGSLNTDGEVLTVAWSEAETQQLLKQAHRAYNTEVNDLLLTALGLAIHSWTGAERVLVNLEGHGREAILPEVDITRTVGWFTSLYPVLLETGKGMTLAQRIKETKEGLRGIPDKGLTYGTWRYLSHASAADEERTILAEPEISFNYLGQVDQDLQNSGITLSSYGVGETDDANSPLPHTLDLNAMISEGTLRLTIAYSRKQYRKETLERVAGLLQAALQEVIAHCIAQEQPELTPSDVSFKGLTNGELGEIAEQAARTGELENVYALTPMQKGMLFYNLMDSQSGAYFEQASFDLQGNFNVAAFAASLDVLVQRHTALRTNFYSGWKDEPLQVVYRNKRSELYVEDLRDVEEEKQNDYILEFTRKDKQRGFDLAQDALMRVSILRTGEDSYRFVWSFHHIVMDGWCLSLVTNEVFASYFATLAHKQPELAPVTPYSQYIEWLEQQDRQEASNYWSDYLNGYEEQSRLPQAKKQGKTGYQAERLDFDLGTRLTAGIQRIAKHYQVTMNTLVQTVWGILLQKYNGTDDVVFGSVVSGRPADIPNVEHIIGLFINTVPVRIRSGEDPLFSELMKQNQEQSIASHTYDTYPLYEIQGLSELKQDLINHILIFENFPMEEQMEQLGDGEESNFSITGVESVEQTNYDFNLVVLPGNTIQMSFGYNALAFEHESVEQIRGHLVQLLEQVTAKPDIRVQELDILSEQEREQILGVWGNTGAEYPSEQTIHGLFEAQTAQTPEQVALFFEGEQLTYRELNERANRLARTLCSQGVMKDRLVGLMTERSVDMIVGIFGILKAGGAYVPIDPTYPEERIRYMLDDSGADLLLTQNHLVEKVAFDGKVLVLDGEQAVYHEDGSNLEPLSGPNDLAYVIYTSGTTGQPKGVMLEHHGLCNLKTYFDQTLRISMSDHALLFASYSFDAACWEIFQALFCGATLYVPTSETILNYERFEQYMADHQITVAALPPTYAVYLEPERMPNLRILFTAGSASSTELVYKWKDQVAYYNGYGPTENSVATSIWPVSEDERAGQLISIGRPVPNHRVYLVDAHGHLVPVGVAGELCVSGPGLARGYLDRPELTAEKFVPNPFTAGEAGYERMYRTGDLARWMPDGNIEYLGRIDHQVKIRGYRIELGEVEAQMLKVEDVQEVIVLAHADEQGQNQLVAYYVAEREVNVGELRGLLGEELPNYMVPSYFVQLENMPLTPNGKIDRKALPAPQGSLQSGADYVEPRTALEQTLVSVWQSVLGAKRVGILDNFFDLGGDSIKAIQVSSRLLQAGYKLEMKDLFQYPSVSLLSGHVHKVSRTADQRAVSGAVQLTPIQQWFFGQSAAEPHYFNQSVMLYRAQGFDEAALRQTVTKVTEHHDALRMVFRQTEQGYEAWNRGLNEGKLYSLDVVDLTDLGDSADVVTTIEVKANAIQSSIRLDEGPLLKLGLFRCTDGDHLLIAVHHLVVDGISWRIIFEDFATGYEQAVQGEAIRLPYKTDSFSAWAERLSQYAISPAIEDERQYWQNLAQTELVSLPKDHERAEGQHSLLRDSETVTVAWSEQETRLLLQEAHRAYNTEVNDLLLTALGTALYNWSGQERVLVNLEGHGREAIIPDIDITRTVGWFTSQYPVLLDVDGKVEVGQRIKRVKEDLRHVPHKGIGYGILKYMSQDDESHSSTLQPEISFNYLGQFDQDLENSDISLSSHTGGEPMSDSTLLEHPLNVNGMITAGVLTLEIRYDSKVYHPENVENFARLLQESLQEVIVHCVSKERSELTPSDVLFKGLTLKQLEQLTEQTASVGELENVYALSPMQKGMLFHSLMEPESGAYFQQASFDQKGSFDVAIFRKSLDLLTQRHEALRTNFHMFETGHSQEPLQIVFRHKDSDLSFKDVRGMQEAERKAYIQAFKLEDQARGFNLGTDALMRVQVLQTDEETYHLVWSFHHIVMDGWCLSLVTGEVFGTYFALLEQKQPELAAITPYSQYIEWLGRQDERTAKEYWSSYLTGFEQQTLLPGSDASLKDEAVDSKENVQSTPASVASEYISEKITVELDQTWSEAMYRIAKQQQVTINTLMQSVWGVILQKYNNNEDVIFGSVVSGRPTDIVGVENMIGLFINTIPVRIQSERNATFVEVMRKTQEQALASGVYDSFPLYEIQALTEQKQNLINHIMVFENYPVEQQVEQLGEVRPSAFEITNVEVVEQTNYDLDLIVMPDEVFSIMFRYNANVYDRATVERMQGHVLHVIQQIVNNPHIRVNELELVTPEEQAQIIQVWGDTAAAYPQNKTLSALFEEQVEQTPDQVAVLFESETLTYHELNERANRLARTLRAEGVGPDQPVGILVQRSLEMIVGIYAILKAGGAYVPIDPDYPADRIRFMLEDSEAKLVLTQSRLVEQATLSFDGKVLVLDSGEIYHEDGSDLEPLAGPRNVAYVIYTSGSTGKPKGVMVEHHSVINRILWMHDRYGLRAGDTILQKTAFTFDVSVWELFWWSMVGSKVSLLSVGGEKNPEDIVEAIAHGGVSTMHFVPAMLHAFLEYVEQQPLEVVQAKLGTLRHVFASGEALPPQHVARFQRLLSGIVGAKLINLYGPTEATVDVSYFDCGPNEEYSVIPIGKPIQNIRLYIVKEGTVQLQPIGVAGELCISGVGVARGYLNRPELTAEKFVSDPFAGGEAGYERMYRTGDLAKWMLDGNIEYLGRIDHQVKIRGYRIELGEVESQLLKVESVREAVVMARADETGQKQMVAYYVAGQEIGASELRSELGRELPSYMVPSYFVQLEQMPLSPNGKIDRKALPAPKGSLQSGADYVAPRMWVEAKLAQIWQDVLGLARVGVKENFFEIGGHSLRATTLASKIHKELNKPLPLRSIFEAPTIEQLAAVLEGLDQVAYASIPVTEARAFYPLSSAQKRLYVLHQFDPNDVSYNMPSVLQVSGPLDVKRVEDVFRQLIARHATLRTLFELVDSEPMQWIEDTVPFEVEYTEVQAEGATTDADTMVSKEAQERVRQFVRPFDLQAAPLLRVGLVDLGVQGAEQESQHLLMLDMHHIVSDGVSMGVLTDEFVRLYGGEELSPLRIQYKDYAVWQQSEAHQEWMQRQEAYWLNTFRGELPVLDLPTDFARPAVRSTTGDTVVFGLEHEVSERLKELAAHTGSTLYMVLLAAYTALLHQYTGQEDIVVGTPIAGRPHADLGPILGMFVGTLALRNYPTSEQTFRSYVEDVKARALQAYEHQDYPFEELVEKLNVKRDMSRNPLFDTMFTLQNTEEGELKLADLSFRPYGMEQTPAKFDLTLEASEEEAGIQFGLQYATALYQRETVERMTRHFIRLAEAVATNPDAKLGELELITAEETERILKVFNDPNAHSVRDAEHGQVQGRSLSERFEEQAKRNPERVAVVFEDTVLTYAELNEQANRLARVLRAEGVEADQPVGILLERSADILVSILGILKAGGAYVPMDSLYPQERIHYMLQDSGAKVVITSKAAVGQSNSLQTPVTENAGVTVNASPATITGAEDTIANPALILPATVRAVALDDEVVQAQLDGQDASNLIPVASPHNLAYMIYTSGTTGQPKGVMIEQHSVSNLVDALSERVYSRYGQPLHVAWLSAYVFDASVQQIFASLLLGHTLHVVSRDVSLNGEQLIAYYRTHRIDLSDGTPAHLHILNESVNVTEAPEVKHYLIGGEALPVPLVHGFLHRWSGYRPVITNVYGPTETTVDATAYTMEDVEDLNVLLEKGAHTVSIGTPLANQSVYILNTQQQLVPIGIAGELYIGGAGVGRGYLNLPELTAEKFIPNPFAQPEAEQAAKPHANRMYRTGDLARWLPDGSIEYLGRIDHQVKIRGYRIELGEVEAQLLTVDGIQEAVVTAWENEDGHKDLCAYLVASAPLSLPELRNALQPKLPGYMIPTYVVQLDRFPLTPSGKIDRKALPVPEARLEGGMEYVAPRTPLEEQLVRIWQSVLNHPQIGITDNFFEVGGHSLRATTLVAKIHQELHHKLALRDIFQYPTIEQLVQVMGEQTQQTYASIPVVEERAYYPVSSAQKRMYVLSHLEGGEVSYNMPGALIIEGSLDKTRLEQAFRQLIARHETLRTRFEMVDGEVVQRIDKNVEFHVEHVQASEEETQQYVLDFVRAFDLAQAPLLRVQLVENGPQRYVMLYDMHHIISDGVTAGIIVQEFSQLYEGKELPPLRIQYKDYAVWQHADMQSDRLREQENYWLKTMAGEIPALDMPTDFARPAVQRLEGARLDFAISLEDSEQLKQLAAQTGSTLYMVMLAAYSTLLHKYSGQEDMIVGTPIAGRPHAELGSLVGVFLNTLAIRNYPSGDKTFLDYLQEVKEHALSAYEHQDYPFEELVEKLNLTRDTSRNALFDTMFELKTFEQQEFQLEGLTFRPYPTDNNTAKFDLTLDAVEQPEGILCSLEYSTALYKPETIARLAKHFTELVRAITLHPQQPLAAADMVTVEEKAQIIYGFGDVGVSDVAAVEAGALFHAFVEEQAQLVPDHVAVVYEEQQLTYRKLNERANQLARKLRSEGIGRESIVGILSERSMDMLVGVLAVWKAGGAYVPLDADYPSERIRFMLEDSGATVLLTQTGLQERAQVWLDESKVTSEPATGLRLQTVLALDDESLYTGDTTDVEHINEPQDLAYVIYTSGTTGRPKGVMIEHRSLVNTAAAYRRDYRLNQFPVRLLQLASFSFDVFVGDIARTLYNGGTMVICPKDDRIDPSRLYGWIHDYQITVFESTPALIIPFMQHVYEHGLDMSSLELLITSSDSCSVTDYRVLQERFGADIRIINSYGVTEAAIDSSFYDEELSKLPDSGSVPIGQAWLNARFYIVDSQLNPVPIGVLGELCIGGAGVARGYLNREDLTAEKFVANPYVPGERLYRTGDLARWMPDGNVDFIGRMDYQVKIRGYRIELGEIETAIQRVPGVRQAVVIDRTDERGHKYLCGYITGESELRIEEVQAQLEAGLPAHMVPARLMRLDTLPLTSNGKIDRKALPEPEGSIHTGAAYVAPRTTVEQVLASVWAGVLGVEAVGTQDNFFELGGDSIKALQVSSRLLQAGYRLDMKDLFSHPTVSALALRVQSVTRLADQSEVVGDVKLTPVQQWFFEQNLTEAHHHNQSIMLYSKDGFDEAALRKAMDQIVGHHDALRTIFRHTEHGYEAWNRAIGEGELYTLERTDFRNEAEVSAAIEAKANEIQAGIDLSEGPLVKLGLFSSSDGDHLLIAIHHLVVDGVSWRILFEDITTAYEQALNGQAIRLPHKTDSFRTWADEQSQYANGSAVVSEHVFWKGIEQGMYEPLPKDQPQPYSLNRDSEIITATWTGQETEQLLKQAHRAYNTDMNDLLLTALGMAIHRWAGIERVLVNLEGHGRESILPELDITRTVGWFTTQFPVVLDMSVGQDLSQHIKNVKEGLRHIPQKGIGYGILRYLSAVREHERFVTEPEISFNYLGQFDQDLQNQSIGVSPYSSGAELSAHAARSYALDINGLISEGELQLTISYSNQEYRRETMEQLAKEFRTSLQEIITHCTGRKQQELTPSDVMLKNVTMAELDQLVEQTRNIGELENVYALTPMQKGMLFHSLMDTESGAYFEQTTFDLRGRFQVDVFQDSLNHLAQRHEIFRANFYSGWQDEPVQVIFRRKDIGFRCEDLRHLDDVERSAYVKEFIRKDKATGFDLSRDALMRVAILRTGDEDYHFVWSSHHILMDGWCVALVTDEVFEAYFAAVEHRDPQLAPVSPYSQYIEWLEAQDLGAATEYWNRYLFGYDQQTSIPTGKVVGAKAEGAQFEHVLCDLGKDLTGRIEIIAKQHHVTTNTLLQTVWCLLLHKYNGSDDAVFGSVVSGRPADIPGIENMVGLFINTIPVRIRSGAGETVADMIRVNQKQALASQAYETYPLYEIQALTEQKQDLINHIMVFENYPVEQQVEQLGEGAESDFEISNAGMVEQTNYDFNLVVIPQEAMKIRFEYNAKLYDRKAVERTQGHLVQLLEQVAANPNIRVHELDILSEQEREQILGVWGDTAAEYPSEQTIHGLFETQTAQTPDQAALFFEGEQLTYRELNERANRLARTLRSQGVTKDRLVGLMTERSVDMIVGIFGILKAGGAYVPIDPTYPEERIRYMLDDSGTKLLLTQSHLVDKAAFEGHVLVLDGAQGVYHEDGSNLEPLSGPNDLAYVIYTSGTTGQPKGVMLEHQGLCNLKTYFDQVLRISTSDHALLFASYSFDAACWEIFQALFCGATLYVPTSETILDYERFEHYMTEHQITAATLPPTYAVYLEPERMPNLRILVTAGSATSIELIYKWKNRVAYYNAYGPTENSVATSAWSVSEDERAGQMISIGRPMPNHRIYMVDVHGHLAPVGVAGELCVSGPGLARGYLDRPEMTAEKFVPNPFAGGEAGYERMYRTGDLARWMPDGNIEYLGRIDHQVKIRGYRIELGEVEAQMLKVEDVQEVIVLAQADEQGQNQLVAYYVAEREVSAGELRSFLGEELPNYMVPSYLVQLEHMPLTPNGKIDRKALPAPEGSLQSGADYVAPRTWVEAKLAQIWQDVLGLAQVGVKENFFEIGGHSLRATTLASKIHKELNKPIPLRSIFEAPTIEQLAAVIESLDQVAYASIPVTEERSFYPLSSAQKRLYVLHQFDVNDVNYNMPSVLQVSGPLDVKRVEDVFRQLIARHATLRTRFELVDSEPMQWIEDIVPFKVEYAKVQAEGSTITDTDTMVSKETQELVRRFVRPFDLQATPLLRVGLVDLGVQGHEQESQHLLMLDMHHIVSDGVSMGVLTDEFVRLYGGEELSPLRIQYKDYAVWQQSEAHQEWMQRQEAYWLDTFRGELPVLDLPTDFARPAVRSTAGDTVVFGLEREVSERLKELAAQTGSTLYMVLLAAYTALLHQYTGQEDIVVGTPIAGRPHADLGRFWGCSSARWPYGTIRLRSIPSAATWKK